MATSTQASIDAPDQWPALPLEAWQDTCVTLQMWLQIVGKLRLSLSPAQNHWWHVPFYVSSRGPRWSSTSAVTTFASAPATGWKSFCPCTREAWRIFIGS